MAPDTSMVQGQSGQEREAASRPSPVGQTLALLSCYDCHGGRGCPGRSWSLPEPRDTSYAAQCPKSSQRPVEEGGSCLSPWLRRAEEEDWNPRHESCALPWPCSLLVFGMAAMVVHWAELP